MVVSAVTIVTGRFPIRTICITISENFKETLCFMEINYKSKYYDGCMISLFTQLKL